MAFLDDAATVLRDHFGVQSLLLVLTGLGDTDNRDRTVARTSKWLAAEFLRRRLLEGAPQAVRHVLRDVGIDNLEVIAIADEIRTLAERYVDSGVLGKEMLADAQHIAAATLSGVDVLASWNFRHMVNLRRIQKYNEVNQKMGYVALEIRSPRELEDED